jgi:hypothetical protein
MATSVITRPSRVFISATSGDLRTQREFVKQILLTRGCMPVEMTNFAPSEHISVAKMLRNKMKECDAIIHIAGGVTARNPTPTRCPLAQNVEVIRN